MKNLKTSFFVGVVLLIFLFSFRLVVAFAAENENPQWETEYGDPATNDYGYDAKETSDGGYIITGKKSEYLYLAKTDKIGNIVWEKNFNEANTGKSVQETSDGGYIVTGYNNQNNYDVYLLKTDSLGNKIWSKTFGGSSNDYGNDVKETSDGGYIVAADTRSFNYYVQVYLIKTDSNGNSSWTKTYGGSYVEEGLSVQETPDGGFAIVGNKSTGANSTSAYDMYLLKTDSSGNKLWDQTYGQSGVYERGSKVQLTADGGFILVGRRNANIYVVKADGTGTEQWSKTYSSKSNDNNSIQQTNDGGYIIAGNTNDVDSFSDVYLLKIDSSGSIEWTKTFGGESDQNAYSIQQTNDGGYIIAGVTSSLVYYNDPLMGGGSYISGNYQLYLIKTPSIPINDVSITNSTAQLEVSDTEQAIVNAIYADGSQGDVTTLATYSSVDSSIAIVGLDGLITAKSVGSTQININIAGITKQISVQVDPKHIGNQIDSMNYNLKIGETHTSRIEAVYDEGTQNTFTDVTTTASYTSLNTNVITVDASGLVTAVGSGTAQVVITYGEFTNNVNVTVLSNNSDLSGLTLSSGGTLSPVFDANTLTYTASVPYMVTDVDVTATLADATANMKIDGTDVASATPHNVTLTAGIENSIPIVVTAQDNSTIKTYTLKITRAAASTNANLSNITLSNGVTYTPTFDVATLTYTASVPYMVTDVDVTATLADATANMKIDGTDVASATPHNVTLTAGIENSIPIVVTAQDNSTIKTYTLKITRAAASTNADLSNITLSNGVMYTPAFDAATLTYTASVPYMVTDVDMTATLADTTATMTVNGVSVTSGTMYNVMLTAGIENSVPIVVTAQDGTVKTYTLKITRAVASTNAELSDLVLSEGTLAPVFASSTQNYTVNVGNEISSLTVTPTVTDSNATVTVNGLSVTNGTASGAIPLSVGDNAITIEVTAQDGTIQTYTVMIKRAAAVSNNADLSSLTLSEGTLSPVFVSNTTTYTASVGNEVTNVDVTPTVADATASISVNGYTVTSGNAENISLNLGSNTITVEVTAQDGITMKTYTITITRETIPVNGVTLNPSTLTFMEGSEPVSLTATVSPSNATNNAVSWSSSDSNVATVSNTGLVTPVGEGTTTITVTTVDGGYSATSIVTVDTTKPVGFITYSTVASTNQDVTATISFTTNDSISVTTADTITITNNDGSNQYIFTENGSFTFEFVDGAGNHGSQTAVVNNIDKVAPIVSGISNGQVSIGNVIITFNEGVATLNGNHYIGGTVISSEGDYILVVTDIAGNSTTLSFTIDKPSNNNHNEDDGNYYNETGDEETEEILVDVKNGNNGTTISKIIIKRTRSKDGKVTDEVTLTEKSVKETITKLAEQGDDTARIVIPDLEDEVSEVYVLISKAALTELKNGGTNLEIETENAKISILNSTLAMFNEDIYFRVSPIKKQHEQERVKEKVKKEKLVRELAKGKDFDILGRPVEIHTNMQNHPVKITLPLKETDIPSNRDERQKILKDLVIFIEHSDGTIELIRGEIVTYKDGTTGVEFEIDKFSTFTMIYMEGSEKYFAKSDVNQEEEVTHKAYITGYPGGTFKPGKSLTRAEMATLLARNLDISAYKQVSYTDLQPNHWAYDNIQMAVESGLMKGYPNGEFKPNQNITRAEMAAIAYRWKKLQEVEGSSFTDTTNHWAANMITALVQEGIMNGYPDGTFKPNQSLSRSEAVTVINKMLERGSLHGGTTQTWPDVPPSHWAFKDIEEASMSHKLKIINDVESIVEKVE